MPPKIPGIGLFLELLDFLTFKVLAFPGCLHQFVPQLKMLLPLRFSFFIQKTYCCELLVALDELPTVTVGQGHILDGGATVTVLCSGKPPVGRPADSAQNLCVYTKLDVLEQFVLSFSVFMFLLYPSRKSIFRNFSPQRFSKWRMQGTACRIPIKAST